jgi:hypothetical protein
MGTEICRTAAYILPYYFISMSHVLVAGGGKRDRTADLLHAMQALSQLSYTPRAKKREYSKVFSPV